MKRNCEYVTNNLRLIVPLEYIAMSAVESQQEEIILQESIKKQF